MRPPIIIAEGLDLSFFRSAEAAATALEGPDVIDGIYRAYDADGLPLALASRGEPPDYNAVVEIAPPADGSRDQAGLAALLREYLGAVGQHAPERAPLSALLEQAVAHAGLRG